MMKKLQSEKSAFFGFEHFLTFFVKISNLNDNCSMFMLLLSTTNKFRRLSGHDADVT